MKIDRFESIADSLLELNKVIFLGVESGRVSRSNDTVDASDDGNLIAIEPAMQVVNRAVSRGKVELQRVFTGIAIELVRPLFPLSVSSPSPP
ncbi:MAG: hypothetical protein SGI77_21040 [Pirellulaceae bacterium]|nr:hypothetical protein [Pirellulaceae bacterium]